MPKIRSFFAGLRNNHLRVWRPGRMSKIQSFLDGVRNNHVNLWVWRPGRPQETILVDLYLNRKHIGQYAADQYRPDLEGAGIGDGRHGLCVDLGPFLHLVSEEPQWELSAFASGPEPYRIGQVNIDRRASPNDEIPRHKLATIAVFFRGMLDGCAATFSQTPTERVPPEDRPAYETMLQPADELEDSGDAAPLLSKYSEFVRRRLRIDSTYNTNFGAGERDAFLKWYIESYCAMRGNRRAPLSGSEIAYLNELMIFGGQRFHLSRATFMFLLNRSDLLTGLNLNDGDAYLNVVYWWAIERSRSLFVEDCLVPDSYRRALKAVRGEWRGAEYPLSRFMEIFFSRNLYWHFLDLQHSEDRFLLYYVLLLLALESPTYLQYLPQHWMRKLVEGDPGRTFFDKFCASMRGADADFPPRRTYRDVCWKSGFDLDRNVPRSMTRTGGRILSAALDRPRPAAGGPCVQIIGPLGKASGLGQAARMSAQALAQTSLGFSCYDFDLDNPAPVGFVNGVKASSIIAPSINLLHLNAESIPLAFAYLPDVFTGAYNIGYFFWELDTPARCHALALELLDEIWVSSQYGVDIYSGHTDKPVTKVGMACEESPTITKGAAKDFLKRRIGVPEDCFSFLVAFDSFSFIQRKNPLGALQAFRSAFPHEQDVRLVVKTHNRDFVGDPMQVRMWQAIDEILAADSRIILFDETVGRDELVALTCACDCYFSLHRSEGWGFGMIEAMSLGVPVVATAYSGNMEFCNEETCWLVDFELSQLDRDDYIFVVPGQAWAEPRLASAVSQLRSVRADTALRARRIAAAGAYLRRHFSSATIGRRYDARLSTILSARSGKDEAAIR